jgi:hypothetical protein
MRLEVYDVLGRRVATLAEGRHGAGHHAVTWDADGLASGIYLCRLKAVPAEGSEETLQGELKMLLIR